jgi:glutamyl/glutaminyl-tRNA synthetase
VVDDEHFGITRIVRGADLLPSTAMQKILAGALGYTRFPQVRFLHHPLLIDSGGRKFSKSDGALSLAVLRREGMRPSAVYRFVAGALGVGGAAENAAQLLDACEERHFEMLDIARRGEEPLTTNFS